MRKEKMKKRVDLIEWQDRDSRTIVGHRRDVRNDYDFDYDYEVFLIINEDLQRRIFRVMIKPFLLILNARKSDMVRNLHLKKKNVCLVIESFFSFL